MQGVSLDALDRLEEESDIFRYLYSRLRECDSRTCARFGDVPLPHEELCAAVRDRIARMA